MRCAYAFTIIMLLAIGGCKNRSSPLTNPFLTPDRVPPPATRVLTQGTAQPYYPGDPLPGAATVAPSGGTLPPAGALPPATTYSPQVPPAGTYPPAAYPVSPVTPTAPITPPAGWNGYSPRAEVGSLDGSLVAAGGGDAVSVPIDQQGLRFQTPPPQSFAAPAMATTAGAPAPHAMASTAALSSPHVQLPIQSMLPLAADSRNAAPPGGAFTPNAGAQEPVRQASYDAAIPLGDNATMQRLQIREVTPAEYLDNRQFASTPIAAPAATMNATTTTTTAASDGFRPQGTSPAMDDASGQSFRPPEIRRELVEAQNSAERFGVGPSQEWLRGQLEYWPETGQWSIRYMSGDGPTDQIGGRVQIENPQVLANLPPGEFVMVRGQLFGRQIDDSSYQPAYRVSTVERQRR